MPFLTVAKPDVGALEQEFVAQAMQSGWVSSIGPFVAQFESEFADFAGTESAVTISNGTDALFIALTALGIGAGDEVIVPALTFVAVASAVVRTGARPHFVDVDPDTWCMDCEAIELAINARSRAVIAVHSYGHPVDMDRLGEIAARHKLYVVEDCAEAHGAKSRGKIVGSIGHVGCFSFYGNKIITTGEGGMITSNDRDLIARCRYLKDHAMDTGRPYYHSEVGYNCRMTNLQAALGCAQLRRVSEFLDNRRRLLSWYQDAFATCSQIKLNGAASWAEPVVWMICAVFVGMPKGWRDQCMLDLRNANIDSRPFFYPLCDLPPYKNFSQVGVSGNRVSISRRLSENGMNLPTSYDLSRSDVQRVADEVMKCVSNAA